MNSFQSGLTFVRSRLTRDLSLLGSAFSGVLCHLFDSHYFPDFCVGSLSSQMLLVFSHLWGIESHSHHEFFAVPPTSAVPVAKHLATQGLLFSVANAVAQQSHGVSWMFC